MLRKAANATRHDITEALAENSRASLKARVILREAYHEEIRLFRISAVALWNLSTTALFRVPLGVLSGT